MSTLKLLKIMPLRRSASSHHRTHNTRRKQSGLDGCKEKQLEVANANEVIPHDGCMGVKKQNSSRNHLTINWKESERSSGYNRKSPTISTTGIKIRKY